MLAVMRAFETEAIWEQESSWVVKTAAAQGYKSVKSSACQPKEEEAEEHSNRGIRNSARGLGSGKVAL